MEQTKLQALYEFYRRRLLDDVVPFWLAHSLDTEQGGFFNQLDRDGGVYDTDKSVWLQGRATWMFAYLYNEVERRQEWLDAAKHGCEFLVKHCYDDDGRMFFTVTRDGRPLRKRRYVFSEMFAAIACSEYARAAGDDEALQRSKATFQLARTALNTPGMLEPKVIPTTRQTRSHAMPMIMIATAQELRLADPDPEYDQLIARSIEDVFRYHVKPEERALLEHAGPNGERLDSVQGRLVNPGHAIESAWFMMREARRNGDAQLIQRTAEIIDWSLARGWDDEYGGLLYFVDVEGKPPAQLEWDMKLWWPHTEALYALLLAHHLTGEARYADWFDKVHDWAFSHFADPEHGEWFGYLRRDGSVSLTLKGSLWKGFFHLPRALLLVMKLLEEMLLVS